MDRRLAVTLGIAALAHAIGWAVVRAPVGQRVPRDVAATSHEQATTGLETTLELLDEPSASPTSAAKAPAAPPGGAIAQTAVVAIAPKSGVPKTKPTGDPTTMTTPSGASSATEVVASVAPAGSGAGAETAKPKFPSLINLDAPGHHAVIFPSSPAPDAPSKEVAAAAKLDAQLKSALDAKDTAAGTGFGGPVAGAAHAAAGMSTVMGWATFDVQTDAFGAVTVVRVVDFGGGGDAKSWQRVAKDLHASMDGRKLKVPTGAGGVAVRVHVEAVMRLPSGATTGVSPVASAGSVGIGFDLSDIGQKPTRRVSVRIVGESRI